MLEAISNGIKARDAFDKKIGMTIIDAAKLHSVLFTLQFFDKKVRSMSEGPIKLAFSRLVLIFAIEQLHVYTSQALETDSVDSTVIEFTKEIFEELLEELHVDALPLAEGFALPDCMIRSTIGHSNGKPYENL